MDLRVALMDTSCVDAAVSSDIQPGVSHPERDFVAWQSVQTVAAHVERVVVTAVEAQLAQLVWAVCRTGSTKPITEQQIPQGPKSTRVATLNEKSMKRHRNQLEQGP